MEHIVHAGDELWLGASIDPHRGFPPDLLDRLATVREREPWAAPWLYATTELYSFGRCYRDWIGWPRWLPLPVYGDHGVVFESELDPHEARNPARTHLTFNVRRAAVNASRSDRRVLLVQHPWVTYRRRAGVELADDRRGTLVFLSHSVPGLGAPELDAAAIADLRAHGGPDPLVVMLHRHDIVNGLHRGLIEAGLPVVTAGNTTSPRFVERFYALVTGFEQAVTDSVSSHVAYCMELGLPIRLLERPLVRMREDATEDGKAAAIRRLAAGSRTSGETAAMLERITVALGPHGTVAGRLELVAELLGVGAPLGPRELRRTMLRDSVTTLIPALSSSGGRMGRVLMRRLRARLAGLRINRRRRAVRR